MNKEDIRWRVDISSRRRTEKAEIPDITRFCLSPLRLINSIDLPFLAGSQLAKNGPVLMDIQNLVKDAATFRETFQIYGASSFN